MSGKLIIVKSGKEATIVDAMDYLADRYGIPADDVRAIQINASVGRPLEITVTVLVRTDEPKMVVEFLQDMSAEEIDAFHARLRSTRDCPSDD